MSGKKTLILLLLVFCSTLLPQRDKMNKLEYYNTVIAPSKGRPPILSRLFGYEHRKRSVLDIGNLVLRFSNAAILGYDRWGLSHEFPAGSMSTFQCCTYYWTLAPIIGGLIKGQPSVAVGVRGAVRDHEEEFEPLPGYDADYVDEQANIGIAFNDKPASWPASWPIETDPTGSYTDAVTNKSWSGIERLLDIDQPGGSGLRFPGVLDGVSVAPREAYFVATDNDPLEGNTLESNGIGPLNVRVDMWALQYDDILNQDFIIYWEKFTNVGKDTLYEVFVGLVGDPDTPEQGGAEWTDDYSLFIHKDDPLMAEKLADTTESNLLWDLGIIWDGDDQSEGFKSSGLGWVGLKALKTPYTQTADGEDNDLNGLIDEGFDGLDNDADGDIDEEDEQEEIGITNYFAYPYDLDAQSDNEAYFTQIRGGFGFDNPDYTGYQEAPHADDINQKPYAYGPDVTTVMTSGPFTLAPGQSVDFVFADILGVNETDLLTNARTAQRLFNVGFKAAQPPKEPVVYGVAGDKEITLYWDAYPSEFSIDPNTGNNAFEGYRVYKSIDKGATWGKPVTDGQGNTAFYVPQTVYDKANDWSGMFAYGSPSLYYDLGNSSGLKYSFTDKTVLNGVEYWYAVSAYDHPDGIVPPLENPPKKSRSDASAPGNNTVILVPQAKPAGHQEGIIDVEHQSGNSTAQIVFDVYDNDRLSGYDYVLTVSDDLDSEDNNTKSYTVLNNATLTEATLIVPTGTKLSRRNLVKGKLSVSGPEGYEDLNNSNAYDFGEPFTDVNSSGAWDEKVTFNKNTDFTVENESGIIYAAEEGALVKGTIYTISYKYYPIYESTLLAGETSNPSFEGVRLTITDPVAIQPDPLTSYWYNPDNEGDISNTNWFITATSLIDPGNPDDYEVRYSTDSTEILSPPGIKVPIELWNTSDNLRIEPLIVSPTPQGGVITSGTDVRIIEVPNNAEQGAITWSFVFQAPEPATISADTNVTVLCDTTLAGNGIYDEGEPFTDLDTSGTWNEGESFMDCYFDSATALSALNIGIANMTQMLLDSVTLCATPQMDTTITGEILDVFQYDLSTFTFDTLIGLKFTAEVAAICDTAIAPIIGDARYIATSKPLTSEDSYLIRTSASQAEVSDKDQLKQVKVVPNPYVVTSVFETNIERKEVQFHYLPQQCTIRIFTVAGELVRVIEHREGSLGWRGPAVEAWDLRSYNNQEVAFGVYIFHVETDGGGETFSETGKFAIIR